MREMASKCLSCSPRFRLPCLNEQSHLSGWPGDPSEGLWRTDFLFHSVAMWCLDVLQ